MSAFDRSHRFQEELPAILTSIAAPQVPDYVDDLLAQTAATAQRPRWTFPERWLPMGVIARRPLFFPMVPWRMIALAAVILALAAAALFIVGSQRHIPPPFGPARNGAIAFGDGDVFVRDSVGGASTLAVGGPTTDFAATFTRDGTRLLFLRRTAGASGSRDERIQLLAANPDGSRAEAVTPPLIAPDWWDIAPDDGSIVVASGDPLAGQQMSVFDIRHPGEARPINLPDGMVAAVPNFLGPTGAEIVFRGRTRTDVGTRSGIFAVKPDGSGLRALTPLNGDASSGYMFPQPSPDGHYVMYTVWDSDASANRLYLLDLQSGSNRPFSHPLMNEGFATFSPDSRRIVYNLYGPDRLAIQVAPVDGTAEPISVGPSYAYVDGLGTTATFSPDGKFVVVNDQATAETRLVDVTTGGDGQLVTGTGGQFSGWQRLAP
jgi:Tol biopolymer transport system component